MLKPTGHLILSDWCHDYISCKLCSWYLWLAGYPSYRIYSSREASAMLQEAGFDVQDAHTCRVGIWGFMSFRGSPQHHLSDGVSVYGDMRVISQFLQSRGFRIT